MALRRAAPSYSNVLVYGNERRDGTVSHPLAVPERRGLRDDGAEDGGGAEEDEGAVQAALPCLVKMGVCIPSLHLTLAKTQGGSGGTIIPTGFD